MVSFLHILFPGGSFRLSPSSCQVNHSEVSNMVWAGPFSSARIICNNLTHTVCEVLNVRNHSTMSLVYCCITVQQIYSLHDHPYLFSRKNNRRISLDLQFFSMIRTCLALQQYNDEAPFCSSTVCNNYFTNKVPIYSIQKSKKEQFSSAQLCENEDHLRLFQGAKCFEFTQYWGCHMPRQVFTSSNS